MSLMRVPFLDLKAQHAEVADKVNPDVVEILNTGAYVLGKFNKGLEEDMAKRHGVNHAIAVNSGTDALRIMLQASDIGPGDEVITTAFTFVATIETILQVGARPVFVDIDPATYMIDASLVEAAITERTKAIMPIHLYGQLAPVEALKQIADRHGLIILEDAAQAIDNTCQGKAAGNWGVSAGISFYVTKNLGAAGDGGMILTNDAEIDRRCRSLRVHGMGRERYYYDEVGYTSRMAEIQACVLYHKLGRLTDWHARRAEIGKFYNEALAGSCVTPPNTLPGNNHTYHQYTVLCDQRDELQAFLKEREIDSMIYYPVPLHYHEPYKFLGFSQGDLPHTEDVSLRCLSLPIHPHLTDEQVAWVADSVKAFATASV